LIAVFRQELLMALRCHRGVVTCLFAAAVLIAPSMARALDWPTRPVTIVVPFSAGGLSDVLTRQLAKDLSERFGQQFVVENRLGGGGGIASMTVAKAEPDGYTLLLTAIGPQVLNKMLYKSIPYEPDRDFTPIIMIGDAPQVMIVNPELPVNSVAELVDYSKKNPGKLTIGHVGPGTMGHLSTLLFMAKTGVTGVLVGYRGGSSIVPDLLGGRVDFAMPAFFPQTLEMKALAVTSSERVDFMPKTPTMRELGVDLEAATWQALYGPAGLPDSIVNKLNVAINDYLKRPSSKEPLSQIGLRPIGGPPSVVNETIAKDKAVWEPLIKQQNIVLDQ
jgi:tripartite-type tricarboxylate transporter receptor subunit TctC